eukprot:s600_g17.t3
MAHGDGWCFSEGQESMPPSFSTLRVPSALLTDAYGLAVAAVKQSLCRASVMHRVPMDDRFPRVQMRRVHSGRIQRSKRVLPTTLGVIACTAFLGIAQCWVGLSVKAIVRPGPRPVASLRQRVSPWRSGRAGSRTDFIPTAEAPFLTPTVQPLLLSPDGESTARFEFCEPGIVIRVEAAPTFGSQEGSRRAAKRKVERITIIPRDKVGLMGVRDLFWLDSGSFLITGYEGDGKWQFLFRTVVCGNEASCAGRQRVVAVNLFTRMGGAVPFCSRRLKRPVVDGHSRKPCKSCAGMSPLSQSCQIVSAAVQVISLGDSPRAFELGTTPVGKAPDDPALQDAPAEVPQVQESHLPVADAPVEESRKVQEDGDKPSHFVCEVNKDGKPLGIRVEYVSDKCIVVAITQGAIPSWNASNPDGKEIRPGDRIVQVNGKDGSPSQLAQQLADAQGLVQMHIQRPGRVALQCKAGLLAAQYMQGMPCPS